MCRSTELVQMYLTSIIITDYRNITIGKLNFLKVFYIYSYINNSTQIQTFLNQV